MFIRDTTHISDHLLDVARPHMQPKVEHEVEERNAGREHEAKGHEDHGRSVTEAEDSCWDW